MNTILVELVSRDFDWNIIINLIGACGVVLGAISGAYLYRRQKDTEWTEKSLHSVYAPLYMLLCSQEAFRDLLLKDEDNFKKVPIISWVEGKGNEGVIHRNKFIEAFDKTNYGLASNKLLMLIGEYRVLVKLEGTLEKEKHPSFSKVTKRKVEVEIELVREIVQEYERLRRKLKIENDTSVKKFNFFEE